MSKDIAKREMKAIKEINYNYGNRRTIIARNSDRDKNLPSIKNTKMFGGKDKEEGDKTGRAQSKR